MFERPRGYYTQDVRGGSFEYHVRNREQKISRDDLHLVDRRPEWQKLRDRKGHSRIQKKR